MARQPTLVGQPVLMVIDIQKSAFMDVKAGIPVMPGYRENMERARSVVDAAHDAGIPVVFIQEIHRRDLIDYGRELDGSDLRVTDYVAGDPLYSEFFAQIRSLADLLLPAYRDEGKSHLSIAFGCTGGQHRSVTVTEHLARALADGGWHVSTRHRELERVASKKATAVGEKRRA